LVRAGGDASNKMLRADCGGLATLDRYLVERQRSRVAHRFGIGLALPSSRRACDMKPSTEEGRTHMMHQPNRLVVPGLLAAALLAAACQDATTPASPAHPNFWAGGGCFGKWTGGGRIDPPDHQDVDDQEDGLNGQQMTGKVTFGFNVFLTGTDDNCTVDKGEIQVVHHQPDYPFQVTWHISIHNGANAIDGSSVPARTYINGHGHRCLVVGFTAARGHAVTLGVEGTDQDRMTVCDNGEPGSSPGFGPDAFRWETQAFNLDTQLQYLTGGNIQDHS